MLKNMVPPPLRGTQSSLKHLLQLAFEVACGVGSAGPQPLFKCQHASELLASCLHELTDPVKPRSPNSSNKSPDLWHQGAVNENTSPVQGSWLSPCGFCQQSQLLQQNQLCQPYSVPYMYHIWSHQSHHPPIWRRPSAASTIVGLTPSAPTPLLWNP